MKYVLNSFLIILIFSAGCSTAKYVNSNQINLLPEDAITWNLEQCLKVINFYTADNTGGEIFKVGLSGQKVYIRALSLNKTSIKALSRKEVIEKRLKSDAYYDILNNYLSEFLNSKYDKSTKKIVDTAVNFSKGYTFKIYFENISDPYEPILLEDGYSYFFLENSKGEFSRVIEVSGLFVEDYFQLDGYLNTIITFSPFSSNGRRLFKDKDINESYKLVFNGLQVEPITIQWNLN